LILTTGVCPTVSRMLLNFRFMHCSPGCRHNALLRAASPQASLSGAAISACLVLLEKTKDCHPAGGNAWRPSLA
jgi:hypothetical protein